ncbi:Gram-negative bacterial tonB protein [compost metagenome]
MEPTANRLQSRVTIGFIVNSDGRIIGQRVIKNIDGSTIAKQMLVAISKIKWKPGYCNKNPVPVYLTIHFNLRLD